MNQCPKSQQKYFNRRVSVALSWSGTSAVHFASAQSAEDQSHADWWHNDHHMRSWVHHIMDGYQRPERFLDHPKKIIKTLRKLFFEKTVPVEVLVSSPSNAMPHSRRLMAGICGKSNIEGTEIHTEAQNENVEICFIWKLVENPIKRAQKYSQRHRMEI